MLHGTYRLILALMLASLVFGCATKTTIHALEPAEIDRSASLKQVAIIEFEESRKSGWGNKRIHFAEKLEALMAGYQLEGKNYFVIVSRKDLDRVLDEQKLQHSGLISDQNVAEIGKLTGAQALISGTVSSASSNDNHYRETRTRNRCDEKGKNCVSEQYSVWCTVRSIGLGVQIRMIDVERGDLVTAQAYDEARKWSACEDRQESLPSPEQGYEALSHFIAEDFIHKIAPRYVSFDVVLMEDPDVDLSSRQEDRFEAAIEFIEAGRIDRAGELLSQLHVEVQHQSYAIAYNLGVIREAEGAYSEAKTLYGIADRLTLEPVEEINLAVERIERLLVNQKRVKQQMSQ